MFSFIMLYVFHPKSRDSSSIVWLLCCVLEHVFVQRCAIQTQRRVELIEKKCKINRFNESSSIWIINAPFLNQFLIVSRGYNSCIFSCWCAETFDYYCNKQVHNHHVHYCFKNYKVKIAEKCSTSNDSIDLLVLVRLIWCTLLPLKWIRIS